MIVEIEINNTPEYAYDARSGRFIVCVEDSSKLWFYGAYSTAEKAEEVAKEVSGVWFERID
jgi:hypothetical protein